MTDAEGLVAAWNVRQRQQMLMLFSPTIGAAIAAEHWFLWVRCPACRTINAIDLRTLDRHHHAAITSLIPALSCRPNAPFAELVQLLRKTIADTSGPCARHELIKTAPDDRGQWDPVVL